MDVSNTIPEPAMAGRREDQQYVPVTTTTTTTTSSSSLSSSSSTSPAAVPEYARCQRILAAVFYAVCATLIVIVNKLVLTSYRFPSFLSLALGQMVVTVVLLLVLRTMGVVKFPRPHRGILKQVWPLPILFFGSIVFSLGGTKRLSLPMVIALRKFANLFILLLEYVVLGLPMYIGLRRFSNLFIMCGEYVILGVTATPLIQCTVYLMIMGSLIAASNDLAFDAVGYTFLMLTNVCSSASGVFTKQKLNMKELGTYGLMFYNSLIMVVPTLLLTYFTGDLRKMVLVGTHLLTFNILSLSVASHLFTRHATLTMEFDHWHEPMFAVQLVMACVLGFFVNYSTMLCTMYNSALTTSIVGVMKNLFITYAGMFIGGDYVYSLINFMGINVSMVGGVMYSYATFRSKSRVPVEGSLIKA